MEHSGERFELCNNSGRVMDTFRFRDENDWPVAPDGSGLTLAKLDPDDILLLTEDEVARLRKEDLRHFTKERIEALKHRLQVHPSATVIYETARMGPPIGSFPACEPQVVRSRW